MVIDTIIEDASRLVNARDGWGDVNP